MSGYDVYIDYLALRNHFNSDSYDYFRYSGKTGVKTKTFDSRKDKMFFDKLAKRPDYHNFLLANFIKNNKAWIRDLAYSTEAEKVFQEWKKRNEALSYNFKTELSKLDDNFNNNFKCKSNEHPILLGKYLANEISLETFCILLDLSKAKGYWDSKLIGDPIWSTVSRTVTKYSPFIKYNKVKFKKIILDKFSNNH